MKRMLLVFVVGLVMFAASAGVSWYIRGVEQARLAETVGNDDKGHGDKIRFPLDSGAKSSTKLPAALDPQAQPAPRATAPSSEQVAQLAASLRQQQETLKNREQNLQTRQKHLEVIHLDLRNERKGLDELRQNVTDEMKALTEKWDSLERKAGDLDKQKKEIGKQAQEVKQSIFEVEGVEQKGIKKMAATFDAVDPDTAGQLLQQMADGGKMDMAAKILATMQERQAARVFTQMQDHATVVQLLDRMKGLKRVGP